MEQKAKLLSPEEFRNLESKLVLVGVAASEWHVDDRGTVGLGGVTYAEDIFSREYNLHSLSMAAADQGGQYVVEVSNIQYHSKAKELGIETKININNPHRAFGFVYKNK